MSRRAALGLGAALAGAAAAALGVWYLFLRDTARPVVVEDVVTSFRDETETTPEGPSPVPEGVYVYETDGLERTDALAGVTHRYPSRSTITVTRETCGVRMRWDVLEGRSTEWTFCIRPAGWYLVSQDERHTFFGRTERTTYTCRGSLLRPEGDRVGTRWRLRCATDSARETGRGAVVGRQTIRVAGKPLGVVHLRRTSSFTGRIRGTASHDIWLELATGVPVRIAMTSETTNDSPVGDVRYDERVTLALRSPRPRR